MGMSVVFIYAQFGCYTIPAEAVATEVSKN